MATATAFLNSRSGKDYPGNLTIVLIVACSVAATGGLIFGYDIGNSWGVASMDSFLRKFFPEVYRKEQEDTSTNEYCRFDSQPLQIFTSSIYLAAFIASFFAFHVTRTFGRTWSMFGGGVTVLVGAALNGAAQNVAMLIVGRILLGIGVGFANQSVPVYLSEMAPARLRGRLNIGFQLMITIGIMAANLIDYGTAKIEAEWGWRLSLALAAVPAAIITVGSLFLSDTPNSLLERGFPDQAKRVLRRIRGTDDVAAEYADLVAASEESKLVQKPWSNILQRKYRPQLTMALLIPIFKQLTGINVMLFYAPVLFRTLGFGSNGSHISTVIIGLVNVFATFVSIFTVDRLGRRKLFLVGGAQMIISHIIVGILIAVKFGTGGEGDLSKGYAAIVVVFICVHVAGFALSWGPLGWLVPSEIFPLEIRSAGQSISVSVNMLFNFAVAQAFPTMLCYIKFTLFYFFAGWVVVMTIFVFFFLPETKNVPIEDMVVVWRDHWFWSRFIDGHKTNVHLPGNVEIPPPPQRQNQGTIDM